MPTKRSFSSTISDSSTSNCSLQNKKRKLRRLPNVYSKVLKLPLRSSSDCDVSVEERHDCFRFVAKAGSYGGNGLDVWAHIVEDHPGVKKLLVSSSSDNAKEFLCDDMLRFRLPANALLEAAKAVCVDGELVVAIPKRG